jgi:hypothetical protein
MKNTIKIFKIIVIGTVIAILMASCATNIATTKSTNFDKRPMGLVGDPNYTVLGPVLLEKDWSGALGVTIPSIGPVPGMDNYLWQNGGITYADLLAKAQEKYPEADAVVDIKVDHVSSAYWVFYAKRTNIMTGIAIVYSKTEVKSKDGKELSGSVNLTF